MKKNVFYALGMAFGVSSCSAGNIISEALQPKDWTGRVCESPIYRDIIGTYRGELVNGNCRWDMEVNIFGTSNGDGCDMVGELKRKVLDQGGSDGSYVCASGTRLVKAESGLKIGDDLTTLRPTSVRFLYRPALEETDENEVELVHPIVQFEYLTAEYIGLVGERGTLLRVK